MKTLFVAAALLFSLIVKHRKRPKHRKRWKLFSKTSREKPTLCKMWQRKKESIRTRIKILFHPEVSENKPRGQKVKEPNVENLPSPDSAKIRSIPKKNFTAAEMPKYLNDLYLQLSKKFPADAVASAKAIATKLGNQPSKLEAAALHAWQNGADEEAVLLITKGAAASGSDGLLLVNAGGILDMYGLSEKAIPVLRTVVSYGPNNVIALNNLGQAYTALGMQDSAMHYLSRCLSLSPQHPEANNTAGHIELKKGNKTRAQSYFENSLRGSFNLSAYTGLATIFKDDKRKLKIAHLIKPKVKKPEYLTSLNTSCQGNARMCMNPQQYEEEFNAYKKMLNAESRRFDMLRKEAEKKMGQNWAAGV